jgi:hypothetical protein
MCKILAGFSLTILLLSFGSTKGISQDSTAVSLPEARSLTASPAEQLRFNLTFTSMWYWYGEAVNLNKQLRKSEEIIGFYSEITGVEAQSREMLRQSFDLKYAGCKDCLPQLETCSTDLVKFKGRAKRRGLTIAIGIPMVTLIGYGVGSIVN